MKDQNVPLLASAIRTRMPQIHLSGWITACSGQPRTKPIESSANEIPCSAMTRHKLEELYLRQEFFDPVSLHVKNIELRVCTEDEQDSVTRRIDSFRVNQEIHLCFGERKLKVSITQPVERRTLGSLSSDEVERIAGCIGTTQQDLRRRLQDLYAGRPIGNETVVRLIHFQF